MADLFLFAVDFSTGALKVQCAQGYSTAAVREDEFVRHFFEQNLLSSGDSVRYARQYVKMKLGG
jgi:hypothetical protein